MTRAHRNRLLTAALIVFVGLAIAVSPVFVQEGLWAGLGLSALSAIAPIVVLLVVAFVWRGNDRQAGRSGGSGPAE